VKGLSDKQARILDFINRFQRDRDYPPTVRDIQRGCQISSTSVVEYNLRVLEREGYFERDREVSRGIKLHGRRPVRVPIIGHIAAGEPIPVPTPDTWNMEETESLDVTEELTRGKEGLYALKVKGTSMIDALIGDGDLVLMQQVATAENGEMVAVWLKGEREATLKRFYLESERVRLQPANEEMAPIYADPENVAIQGKVIGVIRKLG
jgi:repressor LexA